MSLNGWLHPLIQVILEYAGDTSTGRPDIGTQIHIHKHTHTHTRTHVHSSAPILVNAYSVLYSLKHVSFPEIILFV